MIKHDVTKLYHLRRRDLVPQALVLISVVLCKNIIQSCSVSENTQFVT